MPPEDVSDVSEFVPVTTSVPLPLFVKRVVFVTLSSVWVSPSATVYVSPRAGRTALAATATAATNAKAFSMDATMANHAVLPTQWRPDWCKLGKSQLFLPISFMAHSISYCRPCVNCGKRQRVTSPEDVERMRRDATSGGTGTRA